MNYHRFLGEVQCRAELPTTGDAVRATRATLEVLGCRLAGREADHLASQLPAEIGFYLRNIGVTDTYSFNEFYSRIGQREGVPEAEAAKHARAVVSVLLEAVSPGEVEDMKAQLPKEFRRMIDELGKGSEPEERMCE